MNAAISELAKWDSFCVIVGSAAGALIGLQFVVMTLIAGRTTNPTPEAGSAFATPTIVHFSVVLLLCSLLRAPWREMAVVASVLGAIGLIGVLYSVFVTWRMRKQTAYKPEFEDWFFHSMTPLAAYAILAASGIAAPAYTHEALFGVAGAILLLLFTGIHNAWDAAAWHVLVRGPAEQAGKTSRKDTPP